MPKSSVRGVVIVAMTDEVVMRRKRCGRGEERLYGLRKTGIGDVYCRHVNTSRSAV